MFSKKELQAIKFIRNFLLTEGSMPSVRTLMKGLGYKSPRSAAVIFEALEGKGVLEKRNDGKMQLVEFNVKESLGTREQTVAIPLLGEIACGLPLMANENIEAEIPISVKLIKGDHKYFVLRAIGDSMDEVGIEHGDLVLIRQQQVAKNGDNVVALVDDEATIKEFHHKGDMVILKPRSKNKRHQPIILTQDFRIQGIVETIIKI